MIEVVEVLLPRVRSSNPNTRLRHHSWANEIDGRFFDNRRGFGSVANTNDGLGVVDFGISVEAIGISPEREGGKNLQNPS